MLDETTYSFYGADGREIYLGKKSTEILSFLILNKHRCVPQEEIIKLMWLETPTEKNCARLGQIIRRLNEKLKGEARILIKKSVGYRIIGKR